MIARYIYICHVLFCHAAIRQALSKAIVAFYQKCKHTVDASSCNASAISAISSSTGIALAVVDEQSKQEIKDALLQYDRTLLVADPRRCEPKK